MSSEPSDGFGIDHVTVQPANYCDDASGAEHPDSGLQTNATDD